MEGPYFAEEQRFPAWIRVLVVLPVVILGVAVVALAPAAPPVALALCIPLVLLLVLAVLHFVIRLVTTLDTEGLHLRVAPVGWSLLPRHMAQKDVAIGDIRGWEIRTYDSLRDREFWGWHLWGLSAAKGGRYLYVMRPSGPTRGRGVQLDLGSGERLLIGSQRLDELAAALDLVTSRH
jgi:hypothetical protein